MDDIVQYVCIGFLGFLLAGTINKAQEQDMKVCELSHSFDVCFQALNR